MKSLAALFLIIVQCGCRPGLCRRRSASTSDASGLRSSIGMVMERDGQCLRALASTGGYGQAAASHESRLRSGRHVVERERACLRGEIRRIGASVAPTEKPAAHSILINIDKSTQQMTVFVDGVQKYDWPVSTGKRGYSTPSGTFTATSMNEIWYSKEWDNAPMPHAIFFMKDGHAIHGSYEVKHLGKPASHGCVRIAPQNATLLYDLVKANGLANTQVVLSGEAPGGEGKVASSAKSRARSGQVGLPLVKARKQLLCRLLSSAPEALWVIQAPVVWRPLL